MKLLVIGATGGTGRCVVDSAGPITLNRACELAIADVADHINTFYNRTRRHSHLGGISPA